MNVYIINWRNKYGRQKETYQANEYEAYCLRIVTLVMRGFKITSLEY
jgi:hypothetical protein